MIRTALAMLATCTAAHADPSHHWGGSSATLSPGPGVPLAYVDVINRLTSGHNMVLEFTLDLGGFEVAVTVTHGNGDLPDRYEVVPPEGYIAVPMMIDLDEGSTGRIAIYSADGVGT
jgi:hypothetical protein